ncbi:MAG: hypothetical protein ABSG43_24545 [Solirubrobacteraceae bacterium]
MTSHARLYDLILLLSTSAPEEQRAKIVTDVETAVAQADGSVARRDDWGAPISESPAEE